MSTATKTDIDALCVNTIRTLSMDAVQAANSGHPGAPTALAPVAYCGTDIAAAMEGAEVVFVVGPAFATEAFGRDVSPHLRTGMTVVVCPGSCGGALAFNVAATLAGLGCRVTLAGLVGADPEEAQLRAALHSKGVERLALLQGAGLTTISKTRILSDTRQQLLRLDRDGDPVNPVRSMHGF